MQISRTFCLKNRKISLPNIQIRIYGLNPGIEGNWIFEAGWLSFFLNEDYFGILKRIVNTEVCFGIVDFLFKKS